MESTTDNTNKLLNNEEESSPRPPPTMTEIISNLNSESIDQMISAMKDHPGGVGSMLSKTLSTMTPEQMAKARKTASSVDANGIIKKMRDEGIDPIKLKKEMMKKTAEAKRNGCSCISIDASRKIKVINIILESESIEISKLLRGESLPVKYECFNLSTKIKKIYVHYSTRSDRKNKVASDLALFSLSGSVVFTAEEDGKLSNIREEDLGLIRRMK